MVSAGRKLGKITLTVSLLFFGASCKSTAQQQPISERTITINMSASELLPADLIVFNVNINAEADTPQEAFEAHQERETLLADLLKEFDIKEEDIDFEPVRMNKRYRDERQTTVTNQSVSLTFSDFNTYENIQVTLIENGFDSFNGQFSSTEISEGKEKALISAIEAAKKRAELIANSSDISLGPVHSINYSDHQIGMPRKANMMEMDAIRSESSMMDFAQTVSVTANINISFSIE